jgi:phenylacetate-CoA ligase
MMLEYWKFMGAAWELWSTDHRGPHAVQAHQRTRLQQLLRAARAESPFYRRHYRNLPRDAIELSRFPPVTRRELMSNFDLWVTDQTVTLAGVSAFIADPARAGKPFLGGYFVWTSSGTTGQPGIYVHDSDALAVYDALQAVRFGKGEVSAHLFAEMGRHQGCNALVWATGGHFPGIVSAERLRRSHPMLARSTRVFSVLQPVPTLVRQLNEFRPSILATYPTALELLAEEQEAGRLAIHPKRLWTSGEFLSPTARERIEAVFRVAVLDNYASSEFPHAAFGCPEGWLHVNADWVILEPVDAHHRPVAPGTPSHSVLLTNLANRVQPFIRYDMGDSVTLKAEPCRCGSFLPAIRVEGRRDHILALRNGAGQDANILPLAITTAVEEDAGVHRFQLIQTAPDAISVRLQPPEGEDHADAWQRVKSCLEHYLAAQGVPGVALSLDPAPPAVDAASGKLRQVIAANR